jgi:ABC-2 type transport system ATP-binding protein
MQNEEKPQQVVLMENISSFEYLQRENGELKQVLKDINLQIYSGEIWGIIGTSSFELKLLLEIMANIRAYNNGRCVLVERGMVRRKRLILRHVFYIGNSEMLYNNMNVLEYLMLATAKWKMDIVERQEQLLDLIIQVGLGHISLTTIGLLDREEKAVVTLLAAAYSKAQIIVFNLPDYQFDATLIEAITKIALFIKQRGKTLILGTLICPLIEKACTHIGVLVEGKIIYQGAVKEFRDQYDKVAVIIRDKDLRRAKEVLQGIIPECNIMVASNCLLIKEESTFHSDDEKRVSTTERIYKSFIHTGFIPQAIERNRKTVEYALEELMRQYDLSK